MSKLEETKDWIKNGEWTFTRYQSNPTANFSYQAFARVQWLISRVEKLEDALKLIELGSDREESGLG